VTHGIGSVTDIPELSCNFYSSMMMIMTLQTVRRPNKGAFGGQRADEVVAAAE